ncbi:MAG: nitroreductase family protein [Lautropia sp.]
MSETIADLIQQRFGLPTEVGRSRPAAGPLARLLAHRSYRRFTDRPISDEVFEIVLSAALSAPSKSDLQQATIIDVRESALRDAIQALVPAMPWMAQAPRFLVFCGDNRRLRRISELRQKPFPNDTLDMFMNAAVDAGLVLQAFIVAAQAAGLGCCPVSLIRNEIERLGPLLQLPQGVFPVAGLCVGYPDGPGRVGMRLPPSITVHRDRYDADGFDSGLAAYDSRRAAREPTTPDKQKEVQRWGVAEHYTWSEDKARQYSVPQRHRFGAYVRAQGFALE